MSAKPTTNNPLILHKFEPAFFHNLFADIEGKAIQNLSYPLQADPKLECPFFAVSDFASLFRSELTLEEATELVDHVKDCVSCSTIYCEVYRTWEYTNRVTRVEELNYLRHSFSGISTIKSEIRVKASKRRLAKLERKLKKYFQDEISCTVQGTLMAFVEASKKPLDNLGSNSQSSSSSSSSNSSSQLPNLECPVLSVADVFALLDGHLKEDDKAEIQAHISSCNPCQALKDEMALIYKTQHKRPSRSEQLLYLKNVLSPLQTWLDEPAYKFNKKLKRRLNKAESRIQELEQALAQVLNSNAQLMEVR